MLSFVRHFYSIYFLLLLSPTVFASGMPVMSPSIPTQTIEIFHSDGAKQCEADSGQTLTQHQQQLSDAGITVIHSACGKKTGMMVTTVCGADSNTIHVFTIDAAKLDTAKQLGFAETTELPMAEDNSRWQSISCR